jgi:hypothetical protein
MRFLPLKITAFLASIVLLNSCSDKQEQFESEEISDYTNLTVGKYITYRIDSTVFPNFGRSTEVHKYQQKHVVDALVTDNLGRPSYRIYRYIRDSAGTTPWLSNGTYYITPVNDQLEVVEDNLRSIRLHIPMREGFTWKGNRFLSADPYGTLYNFSNDDNMNEWDFFYDNFETAFSYRNQVYTDVWTLECAEENYNVPITDPGAYAARTRSLDRYSKNIGLVYREYDMWEYQPNPGQPGGPYKTGFGITMWMIDHN